MKPRGGGAHGEHEVDHCSAGVGAWATQGLDLLLQGNDVAVDGVLDVGQLPPYGPNQLRAQLAGQESRSNILQIRVGRVALEEAQLLPPGLVHVHLQGGHSSFEYCRATIALSIAGQGLHIVCSFGQNLSRWFPLFGRQGNTSCEF